MPSAVRPVELVRISERLSIPFEHGFAGNAVCGMAYSNVRAGTARSRRHIVRRLTVAKRMMLTLRVFGTRLMGRRHAPSHARPIDHSFKL